MTEVQYASVYNRTRADGTIVQDIKYKTYFRKYEKNGRPRRECTEAEKDLIRTRLDAGVKKAAISRELGVCLPVLYRFIREYIN